jgi:hypothetical protein
MVDGRAEGFLLYKNGEARSTVPIGSNSALVRYLLQNPGYKIIQHGLRHDYLEFDKADPAAIGQRLDQGTQLLMEAGFPKPCAFVAPYDKLSRCSFKEVTKRFRVLSTGWFELRRTPLAWWPGYLSRKIRAKPHWCVGQTVLLSHPGCLLSCHRDYNSIIDCITKVVRSQKLTVLVTHWWEYFRNGDPDEGLIACLHQTAQFLASESDIRVISFEDLVSGQIPLN